MTDPHGRIQNQLQSALKAGHKDQLAVLRMLLAEIKNESIRRGEAVGEEIFLTLVRRGIKQRHEAATLFRRGGRDELADQEASEAKFLKSFLPTQADPDEIQQAIDEVIAAEGLAGPGDIGPLMKAIMARFRDTADGGVVNRLARQALADSAADS